MEKRLPENWLEEVWRTLFPSDLMQKGAATSLSLTHLALKKKKKKFSTSSGGRIIMGCRDMEKCEAAAKEIRGKTLNPHVYARRLDLASMKSIRDFAERIKQGDEPRTVQFKVRE